MCKQNNRTDLFCSISGDGKEEASAEYFAHAAAGSRDSQDSSVPLLPMSRSSSGQRSDSRPAPDKGTSKAVPGFTGGRGECWQGQTSR